MERKEKKEGREEEPAVMEYPGQLNRPSEDRQVHDMMVHN